MNTEASWVFIFPTPYPRSDVLSAKTEKAVGQVPPLGSPLRRTLETFRAWVSYFLVVDCEEMTLASSHSVCCWTVFFPNEFSICISNGRVLMPPTPLQLWVLRLLHRQLFRFLLPLTPPLILLSLGVVLTCSSWSETWIKLQWCSGERRAGWEGVGVCYSSVSHLVVTIYCIFYFFFSVAVLLIYQMVQMFWHNYFSLHYLFMMLFVIVFYTFGIINYVHVKISISKKSVTHGQKNQLVCIFTEFIPSLLDWMIFLKVCNQS